jgi:hypothetical protein
MPGTGVALEKLPPGNIPVKGSSVFVGGRLTHTHHIDGKPSILGCCSCVIRPQEQHQIFARL